MILESEKDLYCDHSGGWHKTVEYKFLYKKKTNRIYRKTYKKHKRILKQIYILLLYIIYIIACRKTPQKQVEKNNFKNLKITLDIILFYSYNTSIARNEKQKNTT